MEYYRYRWKVLLLAVLIGCLLLCGGCGLSSVDGLLLLPRVPSEYVQLQEQLDAVLQTGAVYAVAETGANRQAVQLVDIDGDGIDEALAFFQTEDGAYRVYAFRQQDGVYTGIGMAEGYGSTLQAIYYPVCGQNGKLGLAMCWGFDDSGAHGMTVYGFTENGLSVLLDTQYADVSVQDADGDGLSELAFAVKDGVTGFFSARLYQMREGQYRQVFDIPLCLEVKNVIRMSFDPPKGGEYSLFVDSAATTGGYVTDLIRYDGHAAQNWTMDPVSGSGVITWRSVSVSCADITEDGQMEIPVTHHFEREQSETDSRCRLDWMDFSGKGEYTRAAETFHVPEENWYLIWPERWGDRVQAEKKHTAFSEKTVFYTESREKEMESLMTVWVFSGDNREEDARLLRHLKRLSGTGSGIYGYTVPEKGEISRLDLSEREILEMFHTIEPGWRTEEDGL